MNYFKTFILIAIMTSLFMFVGYAIGGSGGIYIAFIFALLMNFFAYWNSDKIVLRMYKAKEADRVIYNDFYNIVNTQIAKANLPMPKLYVIEDNMVNAFATGRNPNNAAVAVTTGIWNLLSREEISGVIAHELAHIKNRDTLISTITATFAGAISMIANMLMFASLFGGRGDGERNPVAAIVIMIFAPLAAAVIQMAVSRQREYAADKLGGEICGNPLDLAEALKKLENFYSKGYTPHKSKEATAHMYIINPFSGSKRDAIFSTHPNTSNRIAELTKQASAKGIVSPTRPQRVRPSFSSTTTKNYDDAHVANNPWL